MLMVYGLFVFSVNTAPFTSVARDSTWRWPVNQRTGNYPAYQFVGRGEDSITLSGVLMPEYTGGPLNLSMLRMMADSGKPYLLMTGQGEVLGYWIIDAISETKTHLLKNGEAQKIEFSLGLKRYDGDNAGLGGLASLIPFVTKSF